VFDIRQGESHTVPLQHLDVNALINRVFRTAKERIGWLHDFPTIDEVSEVNIFRLDDGNNRRP